MYFMANQRSGNAKWLLWLPWSHGACTAAPITVLGKVLLWSLTVETQDLPPDTAYHDYSNKSISVFLSQPCQVEAWIMQNHPWKTSSGSCCAHNQVLVSSFTVKASLEPPVTPSKILALCLPRYHDLISMCVPLQIPMTSYPLCLFPL